MYHDFAGREIEDTEMDNMRQDAREQKDTEPEICEVCQKQDGPFIRVEVSDNGVHYTWLSVCSDECLHRVTLRWKQIAEVIRPAQLVKRIEVEELICEQENCHEIARHRCIDCKLFFCFKHTCIIEGEWEDEQSLLYRCDDCNRQYVEQNGYAF